MKNSPPLCAYREELLDRAAPELRARIEDDLAHVDRLVAEARATILASPGNVFSEAELDLLAPASLIKLHRALGASQPTAAAGHSMPTWANGSA